MHLYRYGEAWKEEYKNKHNNNFPMLGTQRARLDHMGIPYDPMMTYREAVDFIPIAASKHFENAKKKVAESSIDDLLGLRSSLNRGRVQASRNTAKKGAMKQRSPMVEDADSVESLYDEVSDEGTNDEEDDKEVELPPRETKKRKLATRGKATRAVLCLTDDEEIEEEPKQTKRFPSVPVRRPRGRPKGSKNKPKSDTFGI